MTAARRKRKQYCGWLAGCAVLAAIALASRAAVTESMVADWHSGLAIGGYDPVAFFTDGKPLAGGADFELRYGGRVWRFCNPGNREAFVARGISTCRNMAATIRAASRLPGTRMFGSLPARGCSCSTIARVCKNSRQIPIA